jgi:hypothetical protein
MATIIANLAYNVSTSLFLPFNTPKYAHELTREYRNFKLKYKVNLDLLNISLDNLEWCIGNFTVVAETFNQRKSMLKETE